ncbi:hypothetical protein DH2020_034734 [Rehmannia glutinosa]|uniref:BED-type domain-containing protein n=1 Tax=Rehmannia glutinosa TaxID=99300 RepID=A0ABR0V9I1_REHGL
MVRKKDPFWEYVDPLDGRFVCKFCGRNFPGGVPRIKSHLSGITGRDIDICANVPDDVQAKAFLAIGGSNKKAKTTEVSNRAEEQGNHSSLPKGLQQSTVPGIYKKKDKDEVDKKLAKFFTLNNIAFNVVQKESFKEFLRAIMDYGPSYKIPSYSVLRTKLIPDVKKDVEHYVAEVKKTWTTTGCTLMSDIWSDLKHRAFINIVAYSPGGAVFVNSFEVTKEKKTMLESVLNVEDELRVFVASSTWRGLEYSKQAMAKNVTSIIQRSEFWKQGKEVLHALEPLVRVLRLVDGEGSTSAYLYEAMERAKEAIKQNCHHNQSKYMQIWTLFEVRRSNNIIHPVHAAATFLNPAYMRSENFREDKEIKEGIAYVLENLVSSDEKSGILKELQLYRMKPSSLFTSTAISIMNTMMMKKFDVLKAKDLEPIDLDHLDELPNYVDHDQDEDGDQSDATNTHVPCDDDLTWLDDIGHTSSIQ